MEEIINKPKRKVLKFVLIGIITLILISGLVFMSFEYKNYTQEKKLILDKKINEVKNEIEQQTGDSITIKEVKKPDPMIKNPLTTINPRYSFQNSSGTEMCYVDHLGNIGCLNNLYFNYTATSTSYFSYIGSSVTKVIKGWFTDLQVDNAINTSMLNATEINEGGNRVALNSTLDIKYDISNPNAYLNETSINNDTIARTNVVNSFSANQNYSANITMTSNGTICYNPQCTAYVYYNGTCLITRIN